MDIRGMRSCQGRSLGACAVFGSRNEGDHSATSSRLQLDPLVLHRNKKTNPVRVNSTASGRDASVSLVV